MSFSEAYDRAHTPPLSGIHCLCSKNCIHPPIVGPETSIKRGNSSGSPGAAGSEWRPVAAVAEEAPPLVDQFAAHGGDEVEELIDNSVHQRADFEEMCGK